MSLIKNNENKNFYPGVVEGTDWHCDWLWSTHRGCLFDCVYCSSKRINVKFGGDPTEIRRLKGEWRQFPKSDNEYLRRFILPNARVFINPFCDIFNLPKDDISSIFGKIYDSGEYWSDRDAIGHKEKSNFGIIMQTKDPAKYFDYLDLIPEGSWLGTTIETDDIVLYKEFCISKAPNLANRLHNMIELKKNKNFKYFITIEPLMKSYGSVCYGRLLFWLRELCPDVIFIGANTSTISLPEPSPDELVALIEKLRKITTIHLKSNLKRLLPIGCDIS